MRFRYVHESMMAKVNLENDRRAEGIKRNPGRNVRTIVPSIPFLLPELDGFIVQPSKAERRSLLPAFAASRSIVEVFRDEPLRGNGGPLHILITRGIRKCLENLGYVMAGNSSGELRIPTGQ